jgi:RNA polymerase sigma factor (sigma-70 family)
MSVASGLRELVEAAKGGDQCAWDQLVERFVPLVASVARRYRLSDADLSDVNQTLWLRLVEHLDQIREPLALPGWIITTTKREALRLIKARNRMVSVDPMAGSLLDGDDGVEVDESLLYDERRQALRDALVELRPHHRELLLLLIAEPPLSYDDISRRLGMPKGSIGPTRARCLEELRNTAALRSFLAIRDSVSGR